MHSMPKLATITLTHLEVTSHAWTAMSFQQVEMDAIFSKKEIWTMFK